jgi:hypothetical protein
MKQISLTMTGCFDKAEKTKREQFLAEMNQVVPWTRLFVMVRTAIVWKRTSSCRR